MPQIQQQQEKTKAPLTVIAVAGVVVISHRRAYPDGDPQRFIVGGSLKSL